MANVTCHISQITSQVKLGIENRSKALNTDNVDYMLCETGRLIVEQQ